MIVRNDREQWIGCDICGELTEISRRTSAETIVLMMSYLKRTHKECERYKGSSPRMVQMQRAFDARVREEFAQEAKKSATLGKVLAV